MKLTKSYLKRIIKEEFNRAVKEELEEGSLGTQGEGGAIGRKAEQIQQKFFDFEAAAAEKTRDPRTAYVEAKKAMETWVEKIQPGAWKKVENYIPGYSPQAGGDVAPAASKSTGTTKPPSQADLKHRREQEKYAEKTGTSAAYRDQR